MKNMIIIMMIASKMDGMEWPVAIWILSDLSFFWFVLFCFVFQFDWFIDLSIS